jgi:hypothetical protein
MGPDRFGTYMKSEIDQWSKVVKSPGTEIE